MAGGPAHSPGQRRDAEATGSDWYAVASNGDSALRITPGLTVGELPGGTLALNDPDPANRWVRFDLAPGGDPGLDVVILSGAQGASGTLQGRHHLGEGAALRLPNNIIYISHDIRMPRPGGRVLELSPADARTLASAPRGQAVPQRPADPPPREQAATLQRERQAVRQPPTWPWAAAAAAIALTTLAWVVLERFPSTRIPPGEPGSAESLDPAARLRTLTEPDPPQGGQAQVRPQVDQTPSRPTQAGQRQAAPPRAEPRRVRPERAEAQTSEAPPAAAESAMAGAGTAGPAASGSPQTSVPQSGSANGTVDTSTGAQGPALGRARTLLEAGAITYPPGDNAVAVLEAVLARDPDNTEAMALMGECTTQMIDAAVGAHDRGLDFEARNTLEEVLGFNPNHERANQLWRQWVEQSAETEAGR